MNPGGFTRTELTHNMRFQSLRMSCPVLPQDSASKMTITRCGPLTLDQDCEQNKPLFFRMYLVFVFVLFN